MTWDRERLDRERRALAEAVAQGEPTAKLERYLVAVAMVEGFVDARDQLDGVSDEDLPRVAIDLLATCRGRSNVGQARADGYRAAVRERIGG